jgi:hypothetical protein
MFKKLRLFFTIDMEKLRRSHEGGLVFIDIIMLLLVMVNLFLIFFDWSFSFPSFSRLLHWLSPGFHQFYDQEIHPNASFLDLIFVSIFIAELLFRWSLAIYRKTFDRWFYYPFARWYDVLGCIPMNGMFKLFRLFRLYSLISKLQRLGIIDFTSTFVYKKSSKYLNVLVEEVSDKVVLNVLSGVQREVDKGNPLIEKIIRQVLLPRQEELVAWLNISLSNAVSLTYYNHRTEFNLYLKSIIKRAVEENQEIKTIALIPGVGKIIAQTLDSAIHNITFNVVDNAMEDLSKSRDLKGIEDITESLLQNFLKEHPENAQLDVLIRNLVLDVLEVVKKQVSVKEWRVKELKERKEELLQKIKDGRGNKYSLEVEIETIEEKLREIHS